MKPLILLVALWSALVLPCCANHGAASPDTVTLSAASAGSPSGTSSASSKSTSSYRAPAADTKSSGGTVQVKGYYRKDGTYVRPHTRRKPRS